MPNHKGIQRWLFPVLLLWFAGPAVGDEPIAARVRWDGHIGSRATGAPLAVDTNGDGRVDSLSQPSFAAVSSVPEGANLLVAHLYWAGTITQPADPCAGAPDDTVSFTPPNGSPMNVPAEVTYCSDGGASSYDIAVARAEVTSLITEINGVYEVNGYSGLISNGSTHNASFSIVVVFSHESLPVSTVLLYDGLEILANGAENITFTELEVGTPRGCVTHYVLDGDTGGSGVEQVGVTGLPGSGSLVLTDVTNPPGNPMNHTINVVEPPQTETIGVDIDRFDITTALTPGDVRLSIDLQAGSDKWWLVYELLETSLSTDPAAVSTIPPTPETAVLYPPHPTPAVSEATISFELRAGVAGRLLIHDVAGRRIRAAIPDSWMGRGLHRWAWDLRDQTGTRVAPGVYFVRLQAGGADLVGKVVVVW